MDRRQYPRGLERAVEHRARERPRLRRRWRLKKAVAREGRLGNPRMGAQATNCVLLRERRLQGGGYRARGGRLTLRRRDRRLRRFRRPAPSDTAPGRGILCEPPDACGGLWHEVPAFGKAARAGHTRARESTRMGPTVFDPSEPVIAELVAAGYRVSCHLYVWGGDVRHIVVEATQPMGLRLVGRYGRGADAAGRAGPRGEELGD